MASSFLTKIMMGLTFSQVVWLIGWLVLASHKPTGMSSNIKGNCSVFCCKRKLWKGGPLVAANRVGAEKSSKTCACKKENFFQRSWQNKRACTTFQTCSSSPGRSSHLQELPSSSHAELTLFEISAARSCSVSVCSVASMWYATLWACTGSMYCATLAGLMLCRDFLRHMRCQLACMPVRFDSCTALAISWAWQCFSNPLHVAHISFLKRVLRLKLTSAYWCVCFENARRSPCNLTASGQLPTFGTGWL